MSFNAELGAAVVAIRADTTQLRAELTGVRELTSQQLSLLVHAFAGAGTKSMNRVAGATKNLTKSFKASLASALSLERVMSRIAFILTVGLFYALSRAVSKFWREAITGAIDFEKQMAHVYTMLDRTTKIFKGDLQKGVEDMAVAFGQSTETLSKGLYDILSASVPVENSLYFLSVATKAATAGFTDTAVSVDALTGIMNAYGFSVDKLNAVANKMFIIVKRGKIEYPELAQNIGKVVTSAAQLGMNFDQLGSSISTMTRQSVKPREAMTALNRLLLQFARSTETAQKIARKYGFALEDFKDPAKGLTFILQKLQNATDQEKIALAGSVRAFKAVSSGVNDLTGQLYDLNLMQTNTTAMQDAYNEAAATTDFRLKQMTEDFKLLSRQAGTSLLPVLNELYKLLQGLFTHFRIFGTAVVTVGKIIGTVFSGIWKDVVNLGKVIYSVFRVLSDVMLAPFNMLYNVSKSVFTWLTSFSKDVFANIGKSIVNTFKNIPEMIKRAIKGESVADLMKEIWQDVDIPKLEVMVGVGAEKEKIAQSFVTMLENSKTFYGEMSINAIETMEEIAKTWGIYTAVVADQLNKLKTSWTATAEDTDDSTVKMTESVDNFFSNFKEGLKDWMADWKEQAFTMVDVMDSAQKSISSAWGQVVDDILDGENMMKKNWANYLEYMVESFIKAVNQMIIKWLAFRALRFAFGGGGGMALPARLVSNGVSGNFSPVINNSVSATFSRRDMGFIVHAGNEFNKNTRL